MMARILVTGGRGALGRVLVGKLRNDRAYTVRVMSRREKPADLPSNVEWARADLETGAGLCEAATGVETIIHAASDPLKHTRQVDVEGTRRLLDHARAAGVAHLIYISIAGVDHIPFGYYQHKLAAEDAIVNGGVPWSILRATQFHYLLDLALQAATRLPIALWPMDVAWQPVAMDQVSDVLCQCAMSGPVGRLPDLGGPQVLSGREIVQTWLQVRGMRRMILPLRLPGKAAAGFRHGYHLCPQNQSGGLTWRQWLEHKYARWPMPQDTLGAQVI